MAIYLESPYARYIVSVFQEYRKKGTFPAPGTLADQTAFTINVFEFLDDIVNKIEQKRSQVVEKKKK